MNNKAEVIQISEHFQSDLFSGNSKFVKDGCVSFNKITLRKGKYGRMEVDYYKDGEFLFTYGELDFYNMWPLGYEYTLELHKGNMQLSFDESLVTRIESHTRSDNFDEWVW